MPGDARRATGTLRLAVYERLRSDLLETHQLGHVPGPRGTLDARRERCFLDARREETESMSQIEAPRRSTYLY